MNLNNIEQSLKTKADRTGRSTKSLFYLLTDTISYLVWLTAIFILVSVAVVSVVAQGVVDIPLLITLAEKITNLWMLLLKLFGS